MRFTFHPVVHGAIWRVMLGFAVLGGCKRKAPSPPAATQPAKVAAMSSPVYPSLRPIRCWEEEVDRRVIAFYRMSTLTSASVPGLTAVLNGGTYRDFTPLAFECIRDLGPTAEYAMPELARAVVDSPDSRRRQLAYAALDKFGPAAVAARPILRAALTKDLPEKRVVSLLCSIDPSFKHDGELLLAKLSDPKYVAEILARRAKYDTALNALTHPADAIRIVLAYFGSAEPGNLPSKFVFVPPPDEWILRDRITAFYRMSTFTSAAVPGLAATLNEQDFWRQRVHAFEVVLDLGSTAAYAAPELATAYVYSPDADIHRLAYESLKKQGPDARVALPFLRSTMNIVADRAELFGLICRIARELRLQDEEVIAGLSSPDYVTRVQAARSLNGAAPPEVLDALIWATVRRDFLAREGLAMAITKAHPRPEMVLPILHELAESTDAGLRARGVAGLRAVEAKN